MKKIAVSICFLLCYLNLFSIENSKDTIKNIAFYQQREFKDNLKEKYSGQEFTYTEEPEKKKAKEEEKMPPPSPIGNALLNGFVFFMSSIFPYILAALVIFFIVKTFLGAESGFWNFKRNSKRSTKNLVFEEEKLQDTDLESFLKHAIENKQFRLAIRYYYLSVLKNLTTKKIISYHKDKTNTDYLFEIENAVIRKEFSYLSYVYSYVWYGEFPLDELTFITVENKYKSFLNTQS